MEGLKNYLLNSNKIGKNHLNFNISTFVVIGDILIKSELYNYNGKEVKEWH
jgi:hypothetical protein